MAKTVVIEVLVKDGELQALTSEVEGLGGKITDVKTSAKVADKEVKNLGSNSKVISKLDSLTGGWASSIVDVASGLKDVVKGLNLSKTALIATGIGAFVVILGTIISQWEDIKESITGVNIELQEQKELTDQINLSLERRNQLEKDNARYVDVRTKERLLRAKIAGASEDELTKIERDGLVERLRLAEEYAAKADEIYANSVKADEDVFLKAQENQIKAYDELAKARSAIGFFDLESEVPEKGKKSGKRDKDKAAEELTGEELAAQTEKEQLLFESLFSLKEQHQNAFQALKQSDYDWTKEKDIQASIDAAKQAEYREMIARQEAKAKMAAVDLASRGLEAASELVGRQTAMGKTLAVAGALIATYQSAVLAYKSQLEGTGPAGPYLGIAAAGIAVASGLAQVKAINAVKVPGSGGGGAAPSTPPAFNVVDSNPQNQLNQTLVENSNVPVKAFVVDKDVTTGQELERNKIESSSIG